MKKILLIAFIASGLATSIVSCTSSSDEIKSTQAEEKAFYKCPMDCEDGKTYSKMGSCPVCEMDLDTLSE